MTGMLLCLLAGYGLPILSKVIVKYDEQKLGKKYSTDDLHGHWFVYSWVMLTCGIGLGAYFAK